MTIEAVSLVSSGKIRIFIYTGIEVVAKMRSHLTSLRRLSYHDSHAGHVRDPPILVVPSFNLIPTTYSSWSYHLLSALRFPVSKLPN